MVTKRAQQDINIQRGRERDVQRSQIVPQKTLRGCGRQVEWHTLRHLEHGNAHYREAPVGSYDAQRDERSFCEPSIITG